MNQLKQKYPEFDQLLDYFKQFESDGLPFDTQHAGYFNQYFHKGIRRELESEPLKTFDGELFEGFDDVFLCNPNKSSEHTQIEISDRFYALNDHFHRNTDFILSNLFLLSNFSKTKWLELLCLLLFDIDVVVVEGVQSLGRLDESYRLDDESIRFMDDRKYQHHSYIIHTPIQLTDIELLQLKNVSQFVGDSIFQYTAKGCDQ